MHKPLDRCKAAVFIECPVCGAGKRAAIGRIRDQADGPDEADAPDKANSMRTCGSRKSMQ
jgi:hypothetical protein